MRPSDLVIHSGQLKPSDVVIVFGAGASRPTEPFSWRIRKKIGASSTIATWL
jgi:hypothetical protein